MSSREIMDSKNGVTTEEFKYRDPVVKNVCRKFVKRSDVGYAKYGRTLHNERIGGHKDLLGYLNDIQEELMDAILYIQTAREEIHDQMDNMYERRMGIIGQNGNTGDHYDNTPSSEH